MPHTHPLAPLLSICIPAYNRPAWLKRAVRSILMGALEQEQSQIEIIISDDSTGSECEYIVKALMQSWKGHWKYQANVPSLGMAANWNQCIRMASGDYVLLLHDDDYLETEAPTKILQVLQQQPASSALLFGVNVVTAQEEIYKRQHFSAQRYLNPESALIHILTDSSFIRFPGMVVKKTLYQQIGYFDERVGGVADIQMWLSICQHCGLLCIPVATANYTVHTEALTTGMFTPATLRKLESLFEYVEQNNWLSLNILQRCRANYFHQFILAGTVRFIKQRDFISAQQTFHLFKHINIQPRRAFFKWKIVRAALSFLIVITSLFSTSEQQSSEVG